MVDRIELIVPTVLIVIYSVADIEQKLAIAYKVANLAIVVAILFDFIASNRTLLKTADNSKLVLMRWTARRND